MDYTIIGSQVNIASRLESIADPDQIIISHETWSLVKDEIYSIKQRPVTVKGISHPIQTYQAVDFIKNISTKKNTLTLSLVAEKATQVAPETEIREIKLKFDENDPNSFLVVVDKKNSEPVGLITIHRFKVVIQTESDIVALFGQPIENIMDTDLLIAEEETPLVQITNKILERDKQKIYDPIVVTKDRKFKSVVPIYRVLQKILELNYDIN